MGTCMLEESRLFGTENFTAKTPGREVSQRIEIFNILLAVFLFLSLALCEQSIHVNLPQSGTKLLLRHITGWQSRFLSLFLFSLLAKRSDLPRTNDPQLQIFQIKYDSKFIGFRLK
jgi:hypothetical protein